MNPDINSWPPHLKNLILQIRRSPIASLPHSNKRVTYIQAAWKDIASKLGQSTRKCKLQWSSIKLRYAKIMTLIKSGKVSMEAAMSHPETSKYFDGLLSFLDPYVSNMTDEEIPFIIHRSINALFFIKTKSSIIETPGKINSQFVTHRQVKALLSERRLRGETVTNIDTGHLLTVVDRAVECKLGELLLMQNASSNPSNDIANNNDDENTVNVTMMPSKNVQTVHKRNPGRTLIPSKNNVNNNEENTTKTINLGLQSELIIDDDIKIEEDDISTEEEDFVNSQEVKFIDVQDEHSVNNQNVDMYVYVDMKNENFVNGLNEQYENLKEEDFVKDDYSTLEKNINNTTETNYDLEVCLPRARILTIGQHTKDKAVKGLPEDAIVIENNTDDMIDTPPVTDEYIRNFFNELGVVLSMELSLDKQKMLKSRINKLLKNILLNKSDGETSEM